MKKQVIPAIAVSNKLSLSEFPEDFPKLNKLEKFIIAKRMLFKKVVIMPKGQSPKLKGSICNVPVESKDVCNVLPRGMDNNGVVLVKLKRKLCYRGHVYFEPVRPGIVVSALEYLKANNPLYKDVTIDSNYSGENLSLEDIRNSESGKCEPDLTQLEETENPLDEYRAGANESSLTSIVPHQINENDITLAPGEGKSPISMITDENCEELSFPHLFPSGKFGFKVDRHEKLTPTRYFNQRLLNYTQKFAADSDYIFFASSISQQMKLNSQINIAMQKVKTGRLTAGMLSDNFEGTVRSLIANDSAFSFMDTIKGTPAYWKRFLWEVLAMVKQLGLPTFFMTLSCADLRWKELISIISKLNGLNLSEEDIDNLDYFEMCKILNENPVLLARQFQYRVEIFFQEIIVDGPLGKVKLQKVESYCDVINGELAKYDITSNETIVQNAILCH